MGFWSSKSKRPGDKGWRQRRAERYGTFSVKCKLGTVLDMSASGMRLLCDQKPPVTVGQVCATRISFDDGAMPLQVQVRWCKRRGLKKYELGLKFVGLKPGADRVLDAVAKFGLASAARAQAEDAGQGGSKPQRETNAAVDADLPDYYAQLGLEPGASATEIKAAYRKLAVVWHPDRCDAPDAMERFEELHAAYQVLADPKRREAYANMQA